MKRTILFATLALLIEVNPVNAQETEPTPAPAAAPDTEVASTSKTRWSIGLSGVVVDDDGDPFGKLFDVGNSWNFLPYPTRLHVDMAINTQWSFEGAVSYSQFETGKVLNDVVLTETHMFVAADINARFHFLKKQDVFDPYGVAGLGFTYRSALQEQTPTLNVGIGFNIWFVEQFGLNLQTSGRLKLNQKSSNYMLHSAGLVYRF